jgi:single-strand DNA-binding protein
MGADVNAVALVGRLTRDAETRGNGKVLAMRLAFTSTRKVGDEWEDVPNYIDVVTFTAVDALSRLLGRGDQVAVIGRLSWREWEANDGTKRQSHEIVADRVQLLAKPKSAQEQAPPPAREPVADAPAPPLPVEDDLPF